jgi:hypothetical protein
VCLPIFTVLLISLLLQKRVKLKKKGKLSKYYDKAPKMEELVNSVSKL